MNSRELNPNPNSNSSPNLDHILLALSLLHFKSVRARLGSPIDSPIFSSLYKLADLYLARPVQERSDPWCERMTIIRKSFPSVQSLISTLNNLLLLIEVEKAQLLNLKENLEKIEREK